jgi:hypothetical protein
MGDMICTVVTTERADLTIHQLYIIVMKRQVQSQLVLPLFQLLFKHLLSILGTYIPTHPKYDSHYTLSPILHLRHPNLR